MTTIPLTHPRIHSRILDVLSRRANWLFVSDENTADFWVELDRPFMASVRYSTRYADGDGPEGFDHAGTFAVCCENESHQFTEHSIKCVTYSAKTGGANIPEVVDRCLAEIIALVNAHGVFMGVPEIHLPPEANTAGRPGGYRWETDHG